MCGFFFNVSFNAFFLTNCNQFSQLLASPAASFQLSPFKGFPQSFLPQSLLPFSQSQPLPTLAAVLAYLLSSASPGSAVTNCLLSLCQSLYRLLTIWSLAQLSLSWLNRLPFSSAQSPFCTDQLLSSSPTQSCFPKPTVISDPTLLPPGPSAPLSQPLLPLYILSYSQKSRGNQS